MSKTAEEIADDWYCKEYNFEEVRNTPDGQRILERKRKRFIAGYNAASLRSKELQERVETLKSALNQCSDVLYNLMNHCVDQSWIDIEDKTDGVKDYENAMGSAQQALSGEATKEKPSGKWTVSKMFNDSVLLFDGVAQLSLTWDELADKLNASESLEAYNRECKRVDELTEELAKIRGSLIISNNGAKRRGEKITELEGLLKNISEEIHDKPGLYRAWTLINKALGK